MERARIAVTGVGLVTPLGFGCEATWRGLSQGISAVRWLTAPEGTLREVLRQPAYGASILPENWTDGRGAAMATSAVRAALVQARLSRNSPELREAAVVMGTSKPDLQWVDHSWRATDATRGKFLSYALQPGAIAQMLAVEHDCRGPLLCPVAACATGLVSIIRGANLIREGACSTVIAGSADASLHRGLLASYKRLGVLADPGDDPSACCRPFDVGRRGFAVGEGAGILVLEDWKQAVRRGAQPLAEWVDGGMAADPTGLTTIDETGAPLAELLRRVLDRAEIDPRDVDAVQVHGTATPMNDEAEAAALRTVFRRVPRRPLGWGLKGAIGHLMGAAGSVETAACVLALHHSEWPTTVNHHQPLADCPLEFRRLTAADRPLRTVLKVSLGFGGHLAAGVLRRADRSDSG